MESEILQTLAEDYAADPSPEKEERIMEEAGTFLKRLARKFQRNGAETEDLTQIAAMAALKALRSYDAARGVSYVLYAARMAAGEMRHYLRDTVPSLRLPRSLYEEGAELEKNRAELTQALRRDPSLSELSEKLGWSDEKTLDVLMSRENTAPLSLDAEEEETGGTLRDMLFDESAAPNDDVLALRDALAALPQKERILLTLRYRENLSQRETASRLQMTQMQVCRGEKRLLEELRRKLL